MILMASRTKASALIVILLLVGVFLFLPLNDDPVPHPGVEERDTGTLEHPHAVSSPMVEQGTAVTVEEGLATRGDGENEPLYFTQNRRFITHEEFSDRTIIFHENITIASDGKVTLRNCAFLSENNSWEKTILVESNGELILEGVTMGISNATSINSSVLGNSSYGLESRGVLRISNTGLKDYLYLNIINSGSSLDNLSLENSKKNGIYFKSSVSQLSSIHIVSPEFSGINCVFANLTIQDLTIEDAKESGLYVQDSTVNLSSPFQIESQTYQLDLDYNATILTDNATVRDMKINLRDPDSKVVIWSDEGNPIKKRDDSSSSSIPQMLYAVVLVLGVVFVIVLLWFSGVKSLFHNETLKHNNLS